MRILHRNDWYGRDIKMKSLGFLWHGEGLGCIFLPSCPSPIPYTAPQEVFSWVLGPIWGRDRGERICIRPYQGSLPPILYPFHEGPQGRYKIGFGRGEGLSLNIYVYYRYPYPFPTIPSGKTGSYKGDGAIGEGPKYTDGPRFKNL